MAAVICLTTAVILTSCENASDSTAETTIPAVTTATAIETASAEATASEATSAVIEVTTAAATTTEATTTEATTTEATTTEATTTEAPKPAATAKEITLSGNAEDIVIAEDDCYAVGDKCILFIQKGTEIRGDMLTATETLIAEIEKTTGFSYEIKRKVPTEIWHQLYFKDNAFTGINEKYPKIEIGIVNLKEGYVPMAIGSSLVVDDTDYDPANGYHILTHELVHVIQYRNGVFVGGALDEGFATYMQDKIARSRGVTVWDSIQYFNASIEPKAAIDGGEGAYRFEFDDRDTNYQYGFRFVTFLFDTYGEQAFANIVAEATKRNYSTGYTDENEAADKAENTRQIIEIIKSQTSEDVFERFKTWYFQNWSIKNDEFVSYMKSKGADI